MVFLRIIRTRLWLVAPLFFLLSLWLSLWLSIQVGDIERIGSTQSLWSEAQHLRAILPLMAGLAGILIIGHGLLTGRANLNIFYGPLGLTAVYAIVGIASVLVSPDSSVSLYWVVIYLSVPVVSWAIISKGDSLTRVSQLLIFNWITILVAVTILIVIAFAFLNLHKIILDPSNLLECKLRTPYLGESWYELTSGKLRSTGVGRYSAIAALLALGGLWHGRSRVIWAFILVGALLLLSTSGARTSFIGFSFAAALIIFLQGGWKTALSLASGFAVITLIFWSTGLHQPILEHCLLRGYTSGNSLLNIQPIESDTPAVQLQNPELLPVGSDVEPDSTPGIQPQTPELLPIESDSTPGIQPHDPALLPVESDVESLKSTIVPPNSDTSGNETYTVPVNPEIKSIEVDAPASVDGESQIGGVLVPSGLYTFSGRTVVWKAGWERLKQSPLIGYGFQGDRLVLGTHMHNSALHALFQTGWIGFVPFVGAFVWAWISLIRSLTNLARLPLLHKHMLIQSAGVLTFLTLRGIWESTGAFFGVDWLILCMVFLYIQVIRINLNSKSEISSI